MDKVKDGVKALIFYENRFLLTLRDENAKRFPLHWHFPGGGIEDGEQPLEAVKREMTEELCLESDNFLFVKSINGALCENLFLFSLKISNKEKQMIKIGNEGLDFKFLTLDEMRSYKLTEHTRLFIEEEKEMLEALLNN